MSSQGNFEFLKEHPAIFHQIAVGAESAFVADPNVTLIKLRQLGEAFAQDIAARYGIEFDDKTSQADLLFKLRRDLNLEAVVINLFHTLRVEGNKATHQFQTQHREAMSGLKVARELAIWYHRSFGKKGDQFKPGAFKPPRDPSEQLHVYKDQIAKLNAELRAANVEIDTNQQMIELHDKEKQEYEALLEMMDEEAQQHHQTVQETEKSYKAQNSVLNRYIKELRAQLDALKEDGKQSQLNAQRREVRKSISRATKRLSLNEELTRVLIDQQLQEAGWEADTQSLTYQKGIRPEKGRNMAIAEWPTNHNGQPGRADYVLFCGLMPIAAVEAKRENENVSAKIRQAERYARGFSLKDSMTPAWTLDGHPGPWSDGDGESFQLPFCYSCNGRPYVKQLAEQSGTWFRDVRRPSNLRKDLECFHSPDGLIDQLKRDKAKAEAQLKQESFAYLKLRDYQEKAVRSVEEALGRGKTHCLLAMATGTGKTRTANGLIYRFLKTERFNRILFLVDRNALGKQAHDTFEEMPLEENKTLTSIYTVANLGDMAVEAETRLQVATVQAMVRRVLASDNPPPIDTFDCIIVDEAHRGYTLDQEMTEGELLTRDAAQYLSAYRRVLDYFDAVKIALTATPAKHTADIFGKPVYSYSYREAVADDWLIDHEPPIRYQTLLSQNGINFAEGETVSVVDVNTGVVEEAALEDELNFDVESFNRRVITEPFNRVICEQLAQELDPFGEEKALIFCATDAHADMVKRLLDEAFTDVHNGEYREQSVVKITGKSDKVDKLIRKFKNDTYPKIAITVDLLTTGIDVPAISHLVFMRRVRSRILYEQMLGRATRRCDDIGKTVFKIYDPVDIYKTLQDVTNMKPIVKDPNVTLEQLVAELTDKKLLTDAMTAPGEQQGETHADVLLSQVGQKVMRILRKAKRKAEKNPLVREKLDSLHELWGVAPEKLHHHLHELGPQQAAEFIQRHEGIINQLDEVKVLIGTDSRPIISDHHDELVSREQSYGEHEKPADYLESFTSFIKEQINQSAALSAVVNRPRDLTREQLKEVRLLLDGKGYSEAKLQTAWREQTNQDIAAGIMGYIRQAALGEALVPFAERVQKAMQAIYAQRNWTPVQRRWLDRLAKQLVQEAIVDRDTIDQLPAFENEGGSHLLNKRLGDQLDVVLETLNDTLWASEKL